MDFRIFQQDLYITQIARRISPCVFAQTNLKGNIFRFRQRMVTKITTCFVQIFLTENANSLDSLSTDQQSHPVGFRSTSRCRNLLYSLTWNVDLINSALWDQKTKKSMTATWWCSKTFHHAGPKIYGELWIFHSFMKCTENDTTESRVGNARCCRGGEFPAGEPVFHCYPHYDRFQTCSCCFVFDPKHPDVFVCFSRNKDLPDFCKLLLATYRPEKTLIWSLVPLRTNFRSTISMAAGISSFCVRAEVSWILLENGAQSWPAARFRVSEGLPSKHTAWFSGQPYWESWVRCTGE